MCTALSLTLGEHCFARNLDLEYSLGESVIFTPGNFPLSFRYAGTLHSHHAILGAGVERQGYPLYYDGFNDRGLCMASLAFPEFAHYPAPAAGSVAPFELTAWILGQCADVSEAENLLRSTHLGAIPFSPELPLTPVHWIVSDGRRCLVLEPREYGLDVRENPAFVLANSPPLDYHLQNLRQYLHLSPRQPENGMAPGMALTGCSRGIGAVGLPGDLSSPSRFLRAVYGLQHCPADADPLNQALHILDTVSQTRGLVQLENGLEYTRYTGVCCPDRGLYVYTTYENRCPTAVDIHGLDQEGRTLRCFPMERRQRLHTVN